MQSRLLLLLVSTGLSAACGHSTSVRTPLLLTGESSYRLERVGEALETAIDFSFVNRTGGPVYLVNCRGAYAFELERREGPLWQRAWAPELQFCLSPPIVIPSGATFTDTLRIRGALPGRSAGPAWDVEDPSGTYRIVWDARSSYEDEDMSFGPPIPLEERVSNAFELTTR